jgi:hypothetical protein
MRTFHRTLSGEGRASGKMRLMAVCAAISRLEFRLEVRVANYQIHIYTQQKRTSKH